MTEGVRERPRESEGPRERLPGEGPRVPGRGV